MTPWGEWECTECGYITTVRRRPSRCPECGAPGEAFDFYEYEDEEEEVETDFDEDLPDEDLWESEEIPEAEDEE
ncbi:MAG: hypothetical protein RML36_14440 [Anaerolineae bacterium]|nr:hypothetical protein [Anaerolineae bacterium]MDW8100668.1 hypothetical protein [Anaerolineae bacterium]